MNSTVSQSSVYLVQDGEGGLGVPVGGVGHPATWLEKNRSETLMASRIQCKKFMLKETIQGSYDVHV